MIENKEEENAKIEQLSHLVQPQIDYATARLSEKMHGLASGERTVTLEPSKTKGTTDRALWMAIRNRTEAIGFKRYQDFIDRVLCRVVSPKHGGTCSGETDERRIGSPPLGRMRADLQARPAIHGVDAYNLLKLATEIFLMLESGLLKLDQKTQQFTLLDPELFKEKEESDRIGEEVTVSSIHTLLRDYFNVEDPAFGSSARLPYFQTILQNLPVIEEKLPYCEEVLRNRLSCPSMLELIWSYWHEEGMLVQTMKAIALRFQNRRGPAATDPLANLELDPLRPLNNLLWGYIQDEYRQLTVMRRAYEYDHHYGLTLVGRAVPSLASADSRSKFIEAFHNLLHRAAVFFREDADTTVQADGFPLLNALKEVHLILAEGAHNQFGDLPWTARVEMLIQQWLMARPEMREFLRGRYMVPYQEAWMGAVDAMKRLQGWTDVGVSHFRDLAVFGEQILLSVRFGDWVNVNDEDNAKNWARYWKPEIQSYIHSYLAATGVDLAADITDNRNLANRYLQPALHLQRRLAAQQSRTAVSPPRTTVRAVTAEVADYVAVPAASRRRLLTHGADD